MPNGGVNIAAVKKARKRLTLGTQLESAPNGRAARLRPGRNSTALPARSKENGLPTAFILRVQGWRPCHFSAVVRPYQQMPRARRRGPAVGRPMRMLAEQQTSNLGVGGSNPSERANDFNDLASLRRSRSEFKTVFRTVKFFVRPFGRALAAPRAFLRQSTTIDDRRAFSSIVLASSAGPASLGSRSARKALRHDQRN
jgi:hypothetical protein